MGRQTSAPVCMIVLIPQLLAPKALEGLCGILLEKEALRRKVRAKDLRPRAAFWLRKESVFAKRLRGRIEFFVYSGHFVLRFLDVVVAIRREHRTSRP